MEISPAPHSSLMACKLRLALDLLPAQKGRVNPPLRDDGSVRVYD